MQRSDSLHSDIRIPGYRILRPLGQGGMATVYLAVQESFDREVALKVMSPALSRLDSTYGERFLREARIVAKFIDPHIVSVYDVGVANGLHYLAMEYVPGNDLRQQHSLMTLKQCLIVIKQIAHALEQAHHQGYVHRDIKPENILIHRHTGRAVLTDFGIARPAGSEDELNQAGGAIGTPSFMSPEQALGQPLDHRSDLYSLGIVTFYLLTGRVPFSGDSTVSTSMKHALDAIPRLPSALAICQPLIDKALAKHPNQRFQSGNEFAHAAELLLATLSNVEEHFWRSQLQNPETVAEATRVVGSTESLPPQLPARTPALNATAPATSMTSSAASDMAPTATGHVTNAGTAIGFVLDAVMKSFFQVMKWLGQQLHALASWLIPVLGKWQSHLRGQARLLWSRRREFVPVLAVVLVIVLGGWYLFSDDWNVASAKSAYRDGELSKSEYNAVIKALKAEHQEKLSELREALLKEELTRDDYLEAVQEAKREYTGEDDCGSWLGC